MIVFTLETLEAAAFPEVLRRGVEYWENGQVRAMVASGERISAAVTGTLGDYRVRVVHRDGRLLGECECPYKKGFCKHAAAVAWGWLNEPGRFLSLEQLTANAESMSPGVLAGALVRLAERDPLSVAEALDLKFDRFGDGAAAINRLTENLGRGDFDSAGWLAAWRHMLELLMTEDYAENEASWERLLGYAVAYLKIDAEPDAEFWEYFGHALTIWGGRFGGDDEALPIWWEPILEVYRDGGDERRFRLVRLMTAALSGNGCRSLLRLTGYPPADEAGEWRIGFWTALIQRSGEAFDPLVEWAMEDLSRVLRLMDALADWGVRDVLARVAREGLRCFPPENGFLFRERLAANHCVQGEYRQALALLLPNFRERPGWAEYLHLLEIAVAAREQERVERETVKLLKEKGRWELLARILVRQRALESLVEIGPKIDPANPIADEAAQALSGRFPDAARDLWVRRIETLLDQGSRRAVQEAVPLMARVKQLCREQGREDEWSALRARFAGMIPDPVALRMTGALLTEKEGPNPLTRLTQKDAIAGSVGNSLSLSPANSKRE